MSASVPLPRSSGVRLLAVSWPVVLANLVLGLPAYFLAFLFAYGFRDQVGLAEHTAFLVMVAVFATCTGLLGATVPTERGRRFGRRAGVGVLTSLALNAVVVAVGSVVSATHKAEGSVSADFSTTTDVLVVVGLVAVAVACGVGAVGVERRGRHR